MFSTLAKLSYDYLQKLKDKYNMIKITSYREMDKGPLKGFASCEVVKWNFQINDISIFESQGRKWISFPSRKVEKPGEKTAYFPYNKFTDRDIDNRFQAAFFAALDEWKMQNPKANNVYIAPKMEPDHNETIPF